MAGFRSQRQLPTIRELQTIIDVRAYNPAVDTMAFPSTPSTYFWTDSPHTNYPPNVNTWAVQFGDGSTQWMGTGSYYEVRCVIEHSL